MMPSKPPRFGPPRQSERQRKAEIDRRRGTAAQRGYDADWRRARAEHRFTEPLCRFCRQEGRLTPATVVDHIVSIEERPDLRLVQSNLRSLCKSHHDQRTATEQGFTAGKRGAVRPDWLRPATIPVVLVCGAPASGKSTYVAQNASPGDLVVDLDEIASSISGQPKHEWARYKWLHPALMTRNAILGRLSEPRLPWRQAWVIISEPKSENRQWWAETLQPKRIVVLEHTPDVCLARAKLDPDRNQEVTKDAIIWWWSVYQRRNGDEIIKDHAPHAAGDQGKKHIVRGCDAQGLLINDPNHHWRR